MAGGFGFTSATSQYKVFRTYLTNIGDPFTGNYSVSQVAEVHTLGTNSWRNACSLPELSNTLLVRYPTYLNGCVYMYCLGFTISIICFNIKTEQLNQVSMPTPEYCNLRDNVRLGVLAGELCVSGTRSRSVGFWVMKDDSGKVWSKVLSISPIFLPLGDGLSYGPIMPIKYLNDGSLLMFSAKQYALMYGHPRFASLKCLEVDEVGPIVKVISHIPSFVSLKDAFSGLNVKVLNASSRCEELKLHGDSKCVSIFECTKKGKGERQINARIKA